MRSQMTGRSASHRVKVTCEDPARPARRSGQDTGGQSAEASPSSPPQRPARSGLPGSVERPAAADASPLSPEDVHAALLARLDPGVGERGEDVPGVAEVKERLEQLWRWGNLSQGFYTAWAPAWRATSGQPTSMTSRQAARQPRRLCPLGLGDRQAGGDVVAGVPGFHADVAVVVVEVARPRGVNPNLRLFMRAKSPLTCCYEGDGSVKCIH